MDCNHNHGYIQDTLVINRDTLVLKDATGNLLDKSKVMNMLKDSDGEDLPRAIIVEIEATHSGITKNYTEYMPANMKRSAKTWTTPYSKPVLINHDPEAPTLGRVKDYQFMKSVLSPDKDTIKLTLELTDKAAIKRHLDGTALTYSIGGNAKEVFCSICGIEILNADEFCGHWKGNKYSKVNKDGKSGPKELCIWQIGDIEYIEVSEVNIPADQWAQVLNVMIKKEEDMDEEDKAMNKNNTENVNIKDSLNDMEVLKMADNLLETSEAEESKDKLEDSKEHVSDTTQDNISTQKDIATEDSKVEEKAKQDDTVTAYVLKLEEADKSIANLNTEITTLKDELSKAQFALSESTKAEEQSKQQISELLKTKEEVEGKLNDLNNKSQQTFKVNIELAKALKKVYTDNIVDAKIVVGQIDVADSDKEYDTLGVKSLQELSDILEGLRKEARSRRSPAKVTQANIGDEGSLSVYQHNVDADTKLKTSKDKKPLTANEAVDQIINAKRK